MIFVTDAEGQCVYAGKEWTTLTGQDVADALSRGWLDRVHRRDRHVAIAVMEDAVNSAAAFSMQFRLVRPDDTSFWIGSGGVPVFGPERAVIGFVGSITELSNQSTVTSASGKVGQFQPPSPAASTMPGDKLDLIADHLLLAHSLIEEDGVKQALPHLEMALVHVGRALAQRTTPSSVLQ